MKTTWESDFALRTMGSFLWFSYAPWFSPLVTKYCVLVALFEEEKWGSPNFILGLILIGIDSHHAFNKQTIWNDARWLEK